MCKSSNRDVSKPSNDVSKASNDVSKASNDVSKMSNNNASRSFVNDVINSSKLSVSKVDETPDVSRLSDKIVDSKFLQPTEIEHVIKIGVVVPRQEKPPPVPLPRTLTPQKMREEMPVPRAETKSIPERQQRATFLTPSHSLNDVQRPTERRRYFKTPEALKTPSYLKSTTASQQRASPRKIDAG